MRQVAHYWHARFRIRIKHVEEINSITKSLLAVDRFHEKNLDDFEIKENVILSV